LGIRADKCPPWAPVVTMNPSERDHVIVRGRRLHLDELLALDVTSPKLIAVQHAAFRHAKPFEHIVIDGLLNEQCTVTSIFTTKLCWQIRWYF
jgi:hypothetical protein